MQGIVSTKGKMMKVETGIDLRANRYVVIMYQKYYGSFRSLEEARECRDRNRHIDGRRRVRKPQMIHGFGERLDRAIKDKGLTQVAVEKKLGVSHGVVYSYINYGVMPSALTVAKIANILNVSTDWLLGLER